MARPNHTGNICMKRSKSKAMSYTANKISIRAQEYQLPVT